MKQALSVTAGGLRGLILALVAAAALLLGTGLAGAAYPASWLLVALLVVAPALLWGGWLLPAGSHPQRVLVRLAPSVLAVTLVVAGALAVLQEEALLPPVYAGVLAVLGAWDLSRFFLRLQRSGAVLGERTLIGRRLGRLALLGLAAGSGWVFYRFVDLGFNFDRALAGSLVLLVALVYLVRVARREGA